MTGQPKRIVTNGLLMFEHVPDNGGIGWYELVGVYDHTANLDAHDGGEQAADIFWRTGKVLIRIIKSEYEGPLDILDSTLEGLDDD